MENAHESTDKHTEEIGSQSGVTERHLNIVIYALLTCIAMLIGVK